MYLMHKKRAILLEMNVLPKKIEKVEKVLKAFSITSVEEQKIIDRTVGKNKKRIKCKLMIKGEDKEKVAMGLMRALYEDDLIAPGRWQLHVSYVYL